MIAQGKGIQWKNNESTSAKIVKILSFQNFCNILGEIGNKALPTSPRYTA